MNFNSNFFMPRRAHAPTNTMAGQSGPALKLKESAKPGPELSESGGKATYRDG